MLDINIFSHPSADPPNTISCYIICNEVCSGLGILTLTWSYQISSLFEFFSEALSHCSALSPAQTLSMSVSSALMERIPAAFTMACRLTYINSDLSILNLNGLTNVEPRCRKQGLLNELAAICLLL